MNEYIVRLKDAFSRFAENNLVVDHLRDKHYSYAEMEDLSARLAQQLRDKVSPDDLVAMIYYNEFELVLGYLACFHLRATAVPINPALHDKEIVHILDSTKPKLIVTHKSLAERLQIQDRNCFLFGREEGDTLKLDAIHALPRYGKPYFSEMSEDYVALIMHTSGSTGSPKAIPVTAHGLFGNSLVMIDTNVYGTVSRCYYVIPTSYIGGIGHLVSQFAAGGSIVLDEAFSPRSAYRYWATVAKHKPDTLWLTPSMISTLVAIGVDEEVSMDEIRKSVKRAIAFTGAIATDLKQRFEDMFGITIQKFLAITETMQICMWDDALNTPIDSVGKPIPQVKLRICNDAHEAVPIGQEGEIRVGGPWIFKGYWNQPELSESAFDDDGYYRTGDLGCLDAQGNLFITGRIKDTIKCGGLNVAPAEVEAAILAHPDVKEAAVFGIPDEVYGEKIIAIASAKDSTPVSPQSVVDVCRQHIASQKVPSDVIIIDELPHNVVGKVDKRKLKEMYPQLIQKSA